MKLKKSKKENLEEICYWKNYAMENNSNFYFYCLKCNGKEKNCEAYIPSKKYLGDVKK